MESADTDAAPDVQDEAARRREALRKLANGQDVGASGRENQTDTQASRRSAIRAGGSKRWRFWLAAVLVATLVAVVLVSILYRATPSPTVRKPRPQAVEITPASELIACPVALAWSPDLTRLAVVGYSVACAAPNTQYDTGLSDMISTVYAGPFSATNAAYVAMYDTAHGARLAVFSPDHLIFQALHEQALISPAFTTWLATVNLAPEEYLGINYTHLLWSPDRSHIVVTFTCFLPDGPPSAPQLGSRWPGHIAQGLVVADVNGQHGQVYVHVSEPQSAGAIMWDLTTGRVVGSMTPSLPFSFQPAALDFAWDGSGSLQPVSAAPALGAIGAPQTGASSFAVWQPGIVGTSLTSRRPGVPNLSGLAVFATNFAALSPDGHYLVASLGLASLLSMSPDASGLTSLSTPGAAALAPYGWQSTPRLSVRDAGLQQAIALASQSGFSGVNGDTLTNLASVAWRPDGRFVAVSADTPTHAVFIFDCATGKQAAALTPPVTDANNTNASQSLIEWSPDGRSLAYFNPYSGALTLWDKSWLPA